MAARATSSPSARLWLTAALLVAPLTAATSAPVAAQAQARTQTPMPAISRQALSWQLALDRHGFSPGLLDARPGAKTTLATAEFQRSRGLPPTGHLDDATAAALQIDQVQTLGIYTLRTDDPASVTGIPKMWQEKARMRTLGYESLADALVEKFHCSRGLLTALNPGVDLDSLRPGDTLIVPYIVHDRLPPAQHLEVNLAQKTIRALDASGRTIALVHCSIAAKASKRPSGSARVASVTANPWYTFDPAMWPEVKTVKQKLMIPPGPRNPVGLCWIGLSLPGYGIHGTPNPHLIGKTGSHGCFRLANWDALRLAKIVRPGLTVTFVSAGFL